MGATYEVLGDEVNVLKKIGDITDLDGNVVGDEHESVIRLKGEVLSEDDVAPVVRRALEDGDPHVSALLAKSSGEPAPAPPTSAFRGHSLTEGEFAAGGHPVSAESAAPGTIDQDTGQPISISGNEPAAAAGTGEPVPGYSSLSVKDVKDEAGDWDLTTLRAALSYESSHEDRKGAKDAISSEIAAREEETPAA